MAYITQQTAGRKAGIKFIDPAGQYEVRLMIKPGRAWVRCGELTYDVEADAEEFQREYLQFTTEEEIAMARSTQQTARKGYPKDGIKKGEVYWKWSFRFGGVHRSKSKPRPSQLTQSEYLSAVYGLMETIGDSQPESLEALDGDRSEWAASAREIGEGAQERLDSMPEGLQEGDTGQLLASRIEAMEAWADELEGVDLEYDEECDETEDEWLEERIQELKDVEPEIE